MCYCTVCYVNVYLICNSRHVSRVPRNGIDIYLFEEQAVGGDIMENDVTYLWLRTCVTALATVSIIVEFPPSKLKQIQFSLSPQATDKCSHFRLTQYLRSIHTGGHRLTVVRPDAIPDCTNVEFAAKYGQSLLIGYAWKGLLQSSTGHAEHVQSSIDARSREHFLQWKSNTYCLYSIN